MKEKFAKMPFDFLKYNITNPFLATLWLGHPSCRVARLWICKFLNNNKQMAFLQNFISQQLLFFFLFSEHLNTMSNVTDCAPGQANL